MLSYFMKCGKKKIVETELQTKKEKKKDLRCV